MLHGIINEKEHCLDVRDDTSGKMNIFKMFFFKSLKSTSIWCLYL